MPTPPSATRKNLCDNAALALDMRDEILSVMKAARAFTASVEPLDTRMMLYCAMRLSKAATALVERVGRENIDPAKLKEINASLY